MNPDSTLILAVIATAIACLRMIALSRRARDGRWTVEGRNDTRPTAPYRANPYPSRLAIGARAPIVLVVGLATFLSILVTGSAFLPMGAHVLFRHQQGTSVDLFWTFCQAGRSPFVPWIALGNSPDLPIDLIGYIAGWFGVAILLWRSGYLVLRTSPRESTRSILAAMFTMVLTATTWMQDQTSPIWYRWESEPILAVALAISLCLLFVAIVGRGAVENGTVIGDPNSIVSRRSAAH